MVEFIKSRKFILITLLIIALALVATMPALAAANKSSVQQGFLSVGLTAASDNDPLVETGVWRYTATTPLLANTIYSAGTMYLAESGVINTTVGPPGSCGGYMGYFYGSNNGNAGSTVSMAIYDSGWNLIVASCNATLSSSDGANWIVALRAGSNVSISAGWYHICFNTSSG